MRRILLACQLSWTLAAQAEVLPPLDPADPNWNQAPATAVTLYPQATAPGGPGGAPIALGEAARLAREALAEESARIRALRDEFHGRIAAAIPGLLLNGHETERLPNTLNVSFPGVAGWQLLATATALAASTGSACHAGQHAASGVLGAMGLSADRAAGAVRLSLGRFTTESEIHLAAEALVAAWQLLSR